MRKEESMTKDMIAVSPGRSARAIEAARISLSLYWVFWLFLIAGFAGDLIEVVFWLITRGELTSRSSLLYGPFSIVWGAGAVLLTLVFHRMEDQSAARNIFLMAAGAHRSIRERLRLYYAS